MNNMWGKTIKFAAVVTITSALSACGGGAEENRQTVQKPDKTITVIESGEKAQDQVTVDSIQTVDNARGMDFLSEDVLIISRPNPDAEPVHTEGEQSQPSNLYTYNMKTKEAKALNPADENQGFAVLSPDRQHLFYKTFVEATSHGHILNMETGESVKLDTDPVNVYAGEWIDNRTVMFETISGQVMTGSVDGSTEKLLPEETKSLFTAVKGTDGIYYVADEQLYMQPDDGGEPKLLAGERVVWVIPSPDGKQLAVVKRSSDTEMTMYVTDLQGNELMKLGSATQLFGTSWSPDGTKLVYNMISEDGGEKGIFAADTITGTTTPLTVDLQYAADKIRWSPSGTKIVASTAAGHNHFVTYVMTLK
ncbi:hypothetical protein DNH61_18540 [Paenibacillus sambharensis]|uniref:Lipoprotein LpqB beta-propeller domain-containing protein n=1 Tax=Paenibacillus sambharensis TaxID=1803190 RepID=A0A2W1L6E5_9BACL|nr:PD40 domain-containing protein [Paenibacillus sambharensis]PZD94399.1 hypothetical protein DNH61_18540 [Paenibacillus sambharensis]